MNIHEGARRIRLAGITFALIPICWCALTISVQLILTFHRGIGAVAGTVSLLDTLILTAPGILLWIAGWIVQGFAKTQS